MFSDVSLRGLQLTVSLFINKSKAFLCGYEKDRPKGVTSNLSVYRVSHEFHYCELSAFPAWLTINTVFIHPPSTQAKKEMAPKINPRDVRLPPV